MLEEALTFLERCPGMRRGTESTLFFTFTSTILFFNLQLHDSYADI